MTPLAAAKERLSIPEVAVARGWKWKPGRTCRVPYRADRKQSGSVLPCGKLFHDFATGETMDAPSLLSRVENHSTREACRLFLELAGKITTAAPITPRGGARSQHQEKREKPILPQLAKPSISDLERIARLRRVSAEAVTLAAQRGFLHVIKWRGLPCWALTDRARWVCQLRRMDGQLFRPSENGGVKAWTLRGSWAAWPLGIEEARDYPTIALVEGGGDFLASFHFSQAEGRAREIAPVALLGASQRIAHAALPHFRGKRVRIFPHVDPPHADGKAPGMEAAARWQKQLTQAGAEVDCFDLSGLQQVDGTPVGDLNDVTNISADDFERETELSALLNF